MTQHTVSQWSKILKINRGTIYKKIKIMNEEIKPYIHYKNDIMMLDEEAIPILFNTIEETTSSESESITSEERIEELRELVDFLKKEIEQKNQQIEKLTQMNYNTQVLLKEQIEQNKLTEKKKGFFARLFSK